MCFEQQVDGVQVIKLVTPPLQSNTYVVFRKESDKAVIIDANGFASNIEAVLQRFQKTPCAVLLTHGHFDHAGAAKAFQKKGCKIYIHEADADCLHGEGNLAKLAFGYPFETLYADVLLQDKDTIKEASLEFEVIHTPGHSRGSVCYKLGNMIFTGDTLMKNTFGAVDFPGGNAKEIRASIVDKLFTLKSDALLFCGHGEDGVLFEEKRHNPILTYDVR